MRMTKLSTFLRGLFEFLVVLPLLPTLWRSCQMMGGRTGKEVRDG